MANVLADRVKETTTTTGTGTLTLAGAVSGFQTFAIVGNGNTAYYCITSGTDWEIGEGTYTASGTTLSRDTVIGSSAGGAKISVVSGAEVFLTIPADIFVTTTHGHYDKAFSGSFPDGLVVDYVDPYARFSVQTGDGIQFYNGGVGSSLLAVFEANGDAQFNGAVTVGLGSLIGGATNPLIEASGSANGYVQVYCHNDNTGTSASADLAVYPDNGADASGWLDMGITSSTYADVSYPITGANEGYIFMSAPSGASKTGNLIYATDSTGTSNAHQWYVGGFGQAKSAYKMQLTSSGFDVNTALLLAGSAGTSGYVLTSAGAGATPTWQPAGGGGSPGGATGEIQYNNAGAFGGAANVEIDASGNLLMIATTTPTTPAAGSMALFARNRAGRTLPNFVGPSGIDEAVQPALFGSTVCMWLPGTGTTVAINFGVSFTARNNGGTGAAQATPARASTNAMTSLARAQFGTGTTATGGSGIQSANTVAWRGNAAGLGGFYFFARFGIETLASDMRAFVGLSANNAAMAADASTWNNTVGICKDSADSVWQFLMRGTAATKVSTGATITAGQILDLTLFAPPNGSNVTVRLVDAVAGTVYIDNVSYTTNIPAATTFMYMQAHNQSVTGTTAKVLSLNRMYLESDL